ncbi:MAG: hypothetical protein KatS3mg102_2581 [Planctomycetota bacterium]|nr:MAG: hypothetical protein KatS3mg102_2581 [Planctomycetota bacterium]
MRRQNRSGALLRAGMALGLALACAGGAPAAPEQDGGGAIVRLAVDAPGLVTVEPGALAAAGLAGRTVVLEGAAGPLPYARTPDGGLCFFAAPGPLRYAHYAAFVIRAARPGEHPVSLPEATVEPAAWLAFEPNLHFEPLPTREVELLAPLAGSGAPEWCYAAPPGARTEIPFELPAAAAGTGTLRLHLQGERRRAASSGVEVTLNGRELGLVRWSGAAPHTAELALPAGLLRAGRNMLSLRRREGLVLLDRFEITGAELGRFEQRTRPLRLEVVRPADLASGGADWLAIAVERVLPALAPLAAHRRAQGLQTRLVGVQDVYDRFGAGNPSPAAIRAFLAHAARHWRPAPRFVLLVGEAGRDAVWTFGPGAALPTALVDTYDNGATASDHWFVAFGPEGLEPQMAIGRWPSSDPEVVAALVGRTIAYERQAEPGPWRRRLSFVAGEGRFGAAVDRALEEMATRILSRNVPYSYDVDMTYASPGSPYFFPPSQLSAKVAELLSGQAALVTYTGHGHADGFDRLRYEGRPYRIFTREDVTRVDAGARPAVLTIIACTTGAFDDPDEEAIAELLLEWEKGPPAVFAASRISHPYANALLSHDLVASYFAADARWPRRLGEVLLEAKRRLLGRSAAPPSEERQAIVGYGKMFLQDERLLARLAADNAFLYNLLGDPALVLALPRPGGIVLELAGGQPVAGGRLTVRGRVPELERGQVVLTLEVERDRYVEEPALPAAGTRREEPEIVRTHARANTKHHLRLQAAVRDGSFRATLALPAELWPGTYHLKAVAWDRTHTAVGSLPLVIDLPPEDEEG